MLSAGEVGALFVIKDEASSAIKNIIGELERMQGAVDRAKASLAGFKIPPGLARQLGTASRAMDSLGESATKASATMAASFGKIDSSVDSSISRVAALKAELRGAAAESRAIRFGGLGGGAGGGGGEGGGHDNPFHMRTKFEAPGGVHIGTTDAAIGGAAIAGGTMYELFKQGADLISQQNHLRTIKSVTEAQVQAATIQATKIAGETGFTTSQLLQVDSELINPLGSLDRAMEHLPKIAKVMKYLRAFDEKKGGGSHVADDAYDLVKSDEFRGAIKDGEFDEGLDSMARATVATGGKVTPRDWLQFSKYSRQALAGLDSKFLYTKIPELIQEFGGAAEGTALASLNQQIVAGQMRTTGMRLLDQLGYIDPSKVEYDKAGRIVRLQPGANVKAGEFQENPALFAANLVHAIAKDKSDDPKIQRQWESQIFGNRNAAQQLYQLSDPSGRLTKGAGIISNTMMPGEADQKLLKDGDPWTAWARLVSSVSNAFGLEGAHDMPLATKFLNRAADFVDHMNVKQAQENADTALGKPAPAAQTYDYSKPLFSDEYYRRSEAAKRADPEAARGRVMGSQDFANATKPAAPNVNVNVAPPNVNVQVTATLDGAAIAAAVSKKISITGGRVTQDANGYDGRQNEQYPDHGFH